MLAFTFSCPVVLFSLWVYVGFVGFSLTPLVSSVDVGSLFLVCFFCLIEWGSFFLLFSLFFFVLLVFSFYVVSVLFRWFPVFSVFCLGGYFPILAVEFSFPVVSFFGLVGFLFRCGSLVFLVGRCFLLLVLFVRGSSFFVM